MDIKRSYNFLAGLTKSGIDVMTKALFDAKGDLLVGTADNTSSRLAAGADGRVLETASGQATGLQWVGNKEVLILAFGDETTAIAAGTGKITFRMPYAMTLSEVRASLTTAPSAGGNGAVVFDINEGGASILSTKLSIDQSEKTSTTANTPAVISDANLADDAEITVDIDQAAASAAGPKIYLIGRRA